MGKSFKLQTSVNHLELSQYRSDNCHQTFQRWDLFDWWIPRVLFRYTFANYQTCNVRQLRKVLLNDKHLFWWHGVWWRLNSLFWIFVVTAPRRLTMLGCFPRWDIILSSDMRDLRTSLLEYGLRVLMATVVRGSFSLIPLISCNNIICALYISCIQEFYQMLLLLGRVHMPLPQSVSLLSACCIEWKGYNLSYIKEGFLFGLKTNESKQCAVSLHTFLSNGNSIEVSYGRR